MLQCDDNVNVFIAAMAGNIGKREDLEAFSMVKMVTRLEWVWPRTSGENTMERVGRAQLVCSIKRFDQLLTCYTGRVM